VARELDALTHFFFTPKHVAVEASAKVLATQRALPALEMEDITPFSQNSTASAVAPEQVLKDFLFYRELILIMWSGANRFWRRSAAKR
jgi:U3 small nucleolar ribonucleoprotein component